MIKRTDMNMVECGKRLRKLLAERGYTQKELAEISGLTEAAISRIINAQREPLITTAFKIANALGVEVCEIWH